jgi:anti-sigma factor RsiW
MTATRTISDEELCLYLDQEADEDLVLRIADARGNDPAGQARVADLKDADKNLIASFDAMLNVAPEMPQLPKQSISRQAVLRVCSGSMVAGALVGIGLMWGTHQQSQNQPGWKAVVANYQSLYVTETLAGSRSDTETTQAKLAQLSETMGLDLTDLPQVDGLSYVRAQQLGFRGKPLAQLTFLTADGGPVALCIVKTGKADSPDITPEILEGMSAYSWSEDGYGVLLIGPQGEKGLENAAKRFRAGLFAT